MAEHSKRRRRIVVFSIIATLAVAVGLVWTRFLSFERQLTQYCDIQIPSEQKDILYRLGYPPRVLAPPPGEQDPHFYYIYETRPTEGTAQVARMPEGKRVEDFNEWSYPLREGESESPDVNVSFGAGWVSEISCFDMGIPANPTCPPLIGVQIGDSEESVRARLGEPSEAELSGVTKTLYFHHLGTRFVLSKGRVYAIGLNSIRIAPFNTWGRFLMWLKL